MYGCLRRDGDGESAGIGTFVQMAPPFRRTLDGLLDLSDSVHPLISSPSQSQSPSPLTPYPTHLRLQLTSRAACDEYVFVVYLHRPTLAQREEMGRWREEERAWRDLQEKCSFSGLVPRLEVGVGV